MSGDSDDSKKPKDTGAAMIRRMSTQFQPGNKLGGRPKGSQNLPGRLLALAKSANEVPELIWSVVRGEHPMANEPSVFMFFSKMLVERMYGPVAAVAPADASGPPSLDYSKLSDEQLRQIKALREKVAEIERPASEKVIDVVAVPVPGEPVPEK